MCLGRLSTPLIPPTPLPKAREGIESIVSGPLQNIQGYFTYSIQVLLMTNSYFKANAGMSRARVYKEVLSIVFYKLKY